MASAMVLRKKAVIYLLFDLTRAESFDSPGIDDSKDIKSWLNEINLTNQNTHIVIYLVGTHAGSGNRQVKREDAQKYADENGMTYVEIDSLNQK